MRDFPEFWKRWCWMWPTPSRGRLVQDWALDAQWGLDNLTALCAADEKCAEAYDIPARADAALALFDDGPLPFSYTDPTTPRLRLMAR